MEEQMPEEMADASSNKEVKSDGVSPLISFEILTTSGMITLVQYFILIIFKIRNQVLYFTQFTSKLVLYGVEIVLACTVVVLELLYYWADKDGYLIEGETTSPFHFHTFHNLFWSGKQLTISYPYLEVIEYKTRKHTDKPPVPPRDIPMAPPVSSDAVNISPVSLYSHRSRRKFNSLLQK